MHDLKKIFYEQLATGLNRTSIKRCSRWACTYRVMGSPFPGKWSFERHPWLIDFHDDPHPFKTGKKGAQLGFTEGALNICFFTIDIKATSVLYLLPNQRPDAVDFSASRFDPALELSDHLKNLFTDVQNTGHKRAGSANLFIRGSRSRSQLKSIPVGHIIFDEIDEMDKDNVKLAHERTSGHIDIGWVKISTPTVPGHGISEAYELSSRGRFVFKCPHCGRYTDLCEYEHIVVTADHINDPDILKSHYVCDYGCPIYQDEKCEALSIANGAKWVHEDDKTDYRGYSVNQLYSFTVNPVAMAREVLLSEDSIEAKQELYNSKLALTYTAPDAKISDTQFDTVVSRGGGYVMLENDKSRTYKTMGIDVGKVIHVNIDQWLIDRNPDSILSEPSTYTFCKTLAALKIQDANQLLRLMVEFGVSYAVIDAQPEWRMSINFVRTFEGRAKACYYPENVSGRNIISNEDGHTISVDRTFWLDTMFGRFKKNPPSVALPMNLPIEYKEHIQSLIRVNRKLPSGYNVGRYIAPKSNDHFAHARVYSEIAMHLMLQRGVATDTNEV